MHLDLLRLHGVIDLRTRIAYEHPEKKTHLHLPVIGLVTREARGSSSRILGVAHARPGCRDKTVPACVKQAKMSVL